MKTKWGLLLFLFFISLTSCNKFYYNSALKAYENQSYNSSLSLINKIDSKYKDAQTFYLEGQIEMELGNKSEAIKKYQIANELDHSIIIPELISYNYINGHYSKALEIIVSMESSDRSISLSNRKIQYLCLKYLNLNAEAEELFNSYLNALNDYQIFKLKIQSGENLDQIPSYLNELYNSNERIKLVELVDLCYSYKLINNGYLSLLNTLFNDVELPIEFRSRCAYYCSVIFDSFNNKKQANIYLEYSKILNNNLEETIPQIIEKL